MWFHPSAARQRPLKHAAQKKVITLAWRNDGGVHCKAIHEEGFYERLKRLSRRGKLHRYRRGDSCSVQTRAAKVGLRKERLRGAENKEGL